MKFPWKSMDLAPADDTPILSLRCVLYCGDPPRPIDLTLDVAVIARTWLGERSGPGFYMDVAAGGSMGNTSNLRWMPPADYAAIVEQLKPWREAPQDRPVAFLRPYAKWNDAEIVWSSDGTWQSARCSKGCHPNYLDGFNINHQPFRWCEIDDLVPDDWPRTVKDARRFVQAAP